MKVVINSYRRLSHLELGVRITIEDIKNILPDLTDWQAQVVLARLTREHDEGVFYDAAIEQIEKWGKEMYPSESSAKTS
jgi:hypothetical protein|tara:strand:+ start:357 stop:593 length:237 start_codon:yes stop_codon:yes gene_type:complete